MFGSHVRAGLWLPNMALAPGYPRGGVAWAPRAARTTKHTSPNSWIRVHPEWVTQCAYGIAASTS